MSFVKFSPKKLQWGKNLWVEHLKENTNLPIETSSIHENMQIDLEKLHAHKIFWKFHNIFALCWVLLLCN
jgi:hypothetical protein